MKKVPMRIVWGMWMLLTCSLLMGCQETMDAQETSVSPSTSPMEEAEEIMAAADEGIPQIHIDLNQITLEEIHSGSKKIRYAGNTITWKADGIVRKIDDVQMKGRGNSTWGWKKKPYQISFAQEVSLVGLQKAAKWVLLANYRDVSLLRNEAAFYLAREMKQQYAVSGTFVELYVDDEYIGLYYLTHDIGIGENLVDLTDEQGILIEVEEAREPEDFYVESTLSETRLMIKEAVRDVEEWKRYEALLQFKDAFDRVERLASLGEWEAVRQEIDVESFVQYFLLSEFSANPDGFVSSFYMYRDGSGDVIHAGPSWDFDMAFANPKYAYGDATSAKRSWVYADPRDLVGIHPTMVIPLFQYLMDIPKFRGEVETYYQEYMRPALETLPEHLGDMVIKIRQSALRDQDKWRENSKFLDEAERLILWIEERTEYMDFLYGSRVDMADGTYTITSNGRSYCWTIERQQDASYQITDTDTGEVLSLPQDQCLDNNAKLQFAQDCDGVHQRWFLLQEDGSICIVSKLTGLVVDFQEELSIKEYNESETQKASFRGFLYELAINFSMLGNQGYIVNRG